MKGKFLLSIALSIFSLNSFAFFSDIKRVEVSLVNIVCTFDNITRSFTDNILYKMGGKFLVVNDKLIESKYCKVHDTGYKKFIYIDTRDEEIAYNNDIIYVKEK